MWSTILLKAKTAWSWLSGAYSAVRSWLPIAGSFVAGVFTGRKLERFDNMEETLDAVEKKNEVNNTINKLPSGDVTRRLFEKWGRD